MRLIAILLSVVVLLVGAALIGPSFVDWNKYKSQIIEQVDNATGLQVKIDGDIALGILPSPHVKINDLTVIAPRKVNFENLLQMKQAEVSVSLLPLLSKKIVVDTVRLIEPIINIEMLSDGTPSWETKKLAQAKEVSGDTPNAVKEQGSKALDAVSVNALKIKNGVLNFVDHKAKQDYSVKGVNIGLKADSLKGPFDLDSTLVYDEKKFAIEAAIGRLPAAGEELKVQVEVALPDADARFSFGGVAAISEPFEVQGQTNIDVNSLQKLAALFGATAANESFKLDGLLTANQDKIDYNNLKLSIGDFVGNGKFSVQSLKSKNPVLVSGNIKSNSVLNLDPFMTAPKSSASSDVALKESGKAKKEKGLIPSSLTLPMPITANVNFDLGGVKVQGQTVKGVFLDLNKEKSKISASFKALELAGQGKVEGSATVQYASASQSPKTGQVIYADPNASYKINGRIGQLENFLKAFAPDADVTAVTALYKSAQFDLDGKISSDAVSLKDSVVKLDDFVIGLGGRYQPATNNKRAKAVIDVSAGSVDLDKIQAAQGKKKTAPATTSGKKASSKDALKPLQDLSLPLDIGFDVSVQKLRLNGADIQGVRATGDLTGKKLTIKNASVNNYAGAVMSVKGAIANINALTGLDLTAAVKTSDVKKLAKAFKVDTAQFPASLNALDANVKAKGSIDALDFDSNIKALGGQLDASGKATSLLEKPAFNNLAVRIKHSNLSNALKAVVPDFKGNPGLAQSVDFYTKANSSGKSYSLSEMKATLGKTSFGGNLNINTGVNPISVRGSIKAGRIALDQLTGASSGGSSSGSSSAKKKSSGERFSKAAIDLGWMKTVDVAVDLAATSITHGNWVLSNPSTNLKIANGQMTATDVKAGVFGGQANLNTTVKAEPVSVTLNSTMSNIDLEKLAKAVTGGDKLKSSGTVSFKMDIASTGGSAHALVNALNGSANLDGKEIALQGFDLAKMARGLAVEEKLATSVGSLVDGATRGGETRFKTVIGDYKITNGVANVTKMVMDGDAATITTTGSADFPKWFINLDNVIALKGVEGLKPFEVKIKGPLDNPSDTFGKNILEDYLADKLKRKLAKELPDILGSDVTDKLQKFGILPQTETAPAPTPTPSNDNAAPAQQAPKAEPKKIKKPQDALDTLLNGSGKPEDAVNDLIKGLF